jgi:hypothetical protein
MVESGSTLAEILDAGQWCSPDFLSYVDLHSLEHAAVVDAHMEESSGDEDNGVDAYADSSADLPGFGQSNTINIEDPCFDQKLRRQKLLNLQRSVESLARTPMRPMQQ